MTTLHILRSRPDEMVQTLIEQVSHDEENHRVPLYQGDVDYNRLIKDIFESDRVISWW